MLIRLGSWLMTLEMARSSSLARGLGSDAPCSNIERPSWSTSWIRRPAEVPPAQEADERLRRVLEPDDDVLAVADPALAEPLHTIAVEVGEAVPVIGDD